MRKLLHSVALAGAFALPQLATAQEAAATSAPRPAAAESRTATIKHVAAQRRARTSPAERAQINGVREAFDTLVDGIRRADAAAVMGVYWNSPRLLLFNNNGTVTKSWEQVRQNRESLYARVRDVKLDVRDVVIQPLGRDAAIVTTLWEQTQTTDGQPERATGRLTLVFQRIGDEWRAVHAHTSPDRPDPSRLMPSERMPQGDDATVTKP